VLYSFWKSFHEGKNIVLVRQIKGDGKGIFIFLLHGHNPRKLLKWRVHIIEEVLDILSSIQMRIGDYELCLDGIKQSNLTHGTLQAFARLATSTDFEVESDNSPVLKLCLVPFWSFSDLETVGKRKSWDEDEIKQVYFYSGGNLQLFLLGKKKAKSIMDQALQKIDMRENRKLLDFQQGWLLIGQTNGILMASVNTDDLHNYSDWSK